MTGGKNARVRSIESSRYRMLEFAAKPRWRDKESAAVIETCPVRTTSW
jgi:hypothetical protein